MNDIQVRLGEAFLGTLSNGGSAMARIIIDIPKDLKFHFEHQIQIYQINSSQHLDNALLLNIISEARMRFIADLGKEDQQFKNADISVESDAVQYVSEGFYGEMVDVGMDIIGQADNCYELAWRMTEKFTGREVARGITDIRIKK